MSARTREKQEKIEYKADENRKKEKHVCTN